MVVVVRVFVSVCAPYCAFKRTLLAVFGGPIKWPLSGPEKKKRQIDYGPCLALINTYCVIVFLSCTLKVVNTHFFRPLRQSGPMVEHGQLTGLDVRFDFLLHPIFFSANLVVSVL